jgi:hypothetical protein
MEKQFTTVGESIIGPAICCTQSEILKSRPLVIVVNKFGLRCS